MIIWPVLAFEGEVPQSTREQAIRAWGPYARLRHQLETKFDESTAREMLCHKHALIKILFPELFPRRTRKTMTQSMRVGFVKPNEVYGAQWMVKA